MADDLRIKLLAGIMIRVDSMKNRDERCRRKSQGNATAYGVTFPILYLCDPSWVSLRPESGKLKIYGSKRAWAMRFSYTDNYCCIARGQYMKQNKCKESAISGHSCPSAWRVARKAGLIFSGALTIAALAGCANTLPSVDPEEYTKWSKAHMDFPIYSGSYKELSAAVGGSESYMVSTSASVADVRSYYLTEPQKQGWHVQVSSVLKAQTADHCMLIANKETKEALLDITRQGGKTFIGITYGPKGVFSLMQQ